MNIRKTVALLVNIVFLANVAIADAADTALPEPGQIACLAANYDADSIKKGVEKKQKFPDYLFEGFTGNKKKAILWAYEYVRPQNTSRDDQAANFAATVLLKRLREIQGRLNIEIDYLTVMMALLASRILSDDVKPVDEYKTLCNVLDGQLKKGKVMQGLKDDVERLKSMLEQLISVHNFPSVRYASGDHAVQYYMNAMIQVTGGNLDVLLLHLLKEIDEGDKRVWMKKLASVQNDPSRIDAIDKELEQLYFNYEKVYTLLAERLGLDALALEFKKRLFIDKIRLSKEFGDKYTMIMEGYRDALEKKFPGICQTMIEYEEDGDSPEYLRINQEIVENVLVPYYRNLMQDILKKKGIRGVDIEVRLKDGYSVFEKLRDKKNWNFDLISDIVGIRLIFPKRDQVYEYLYGISQEVGEWNNKIKVKEQIEVKSEYDVGIRFSNEIVLDQYGVPVEVQGINREEYTLYKNNSPFTHWVFKAAQVNEDKKQVFEHDRVQYIEDRREYCKRVYEALSEKWVYVFTKETASKKQYSSTVYRPIQLPKDAIPADFASEVTIDALGVGYWGVLSLSPLNVRRIFSPEGVFITDIEKKGTKMNVSSQFSPGDYVELAGTRFRPKGAIDESILDRSKIVDSMLSKAIKIRTKYMIAPKSGKIKIVYPDAETTILQMLAEIHAEYVEKYKLKNTNKDEYLFIDNISILLGLKDRNELFGVLGYGLIAPETIHNMYRGRLLLLGENKINVLTMNKLDKKNVLYAIDQLGVDDLSGLLEELGNSNGTITEKDITRLISRQSVSFTVPSEIDLMGMGEGVYYMHIKSTDDRSLFLREVPDIIKNTGLLFNASEIKIESDGVNSTLTFPLYVESFEQLISVRAELQNGLKYRTGQLLIVPQSNEEDVYRDVEITVVTDVPLDALRILEDKLTTNFRAIITNFEKVKREHSDLKRAGGEAQDEFRLELKVPVGVKNDGVRTFLNQLDRMFDAEEKLFIGQIEGDDTTDEAIAKAILLAA
ncbi:MAG: hypothetical protein JW938_01850 [Candidatus Omnitrophica bacterium]|nr:hypothetical protein [Candidatus Omnitrophota bacterium]